ncbi:hypothetical protein Ancab_035080 [Ancistrocladus abbreviatus]
MPLVRSSCTLAYSNMDSARSGSAITKTSQNLVPVRHARKSYIGWIKYWRTLLGWFSWQTPRLNLWHLGYQINLQEKWGLEMHGQGIRSGYYASYASFSTLAHSNMDHARPGSAVTKASQNLVPARRARKSCTSWIDYRGALLGWISWQTLNLNFAWSKSRSGQDWDGLCHGTKQFMLVQSIRAITALIRGFNKQCVRDVFKNALDLRCALENLQQQQQEDWV